MQRLIALMSFAVMAVSVSAQTGKEYVSGFNSKLLQAKSLTAVYSIEPIGGAPEDYTIKLSKPNLARIATPWETIVADGQTITTFDSLGKTYYKMPDNPVNLLAAMNNGSISFWSGFFDPQAMENVPEALLLGPKVIAGMRLTPVKVTMDLTGTRIDTFYFDSSGLPKKAEFDNPSTGSTNLLNVSDLELGDGALPDATFAFTLPDGAQQLTREEVLASHWYDNIVDATKEATAEKKIIFLLFTAGANEPRTRMENELFPLAAFKRDSKYFVFCNVDATTNKNLAKTYGVTSTPAIFFVKPPSQRLGQVIGFTNAQVVLTAMDNAHKAAG